jgi:hypothetical protein
VDEKADAEFIGTGPYDVQVKIAKGELDGQKAMKEGSFKMKYTSSSRRPVWQDPGAHGEVAKTLTQNTELPITFTPQFFSIIYNTNTTFFNKLL